MDDEFENKKKKDLHAHKCEHKWKWLHQTPQSLLYNQMNQSSGLDGCLSEWCLSTIV